VALPAGLLLQNQPQTVEIYPIEVVGWQNPQNVQEPAQVGPEGDINYFRKITQQYTRWCNNLFVQNFLQTTADKEKIIIASRKAKV